MRSFYVSEFRVGCEIFFGLEKNPGGENNIKYYYREKVAVHLVVSCVVRFVLV